MNRSKLTNTFAALLITAGIFSGLARAEMRVVDGNLWAASTQAEKRAYLIGVANTVAVNRAAQAKRGKTDPGSANDRIAGALDVHSIDKAIERIDTWYGSNPTRKNEPVLGVVWMDMVKDR